MKPSKAFIRSITSRQLKRVILLGVLAMQIILVSDFHPAVILSMDTLRDLGHLLRRIRHIRWLEHGAVFADAEMLSEAERMKLAHLFALLLCLDRRKRHQEFAVAAASDQRCRQKQPVASRLFALRRKRWSLSSTLGAPLLLASESR